MTEYDYSPDALERYVAQQDAVGRWAADASRHSHEYVYPFQEIRDDRGRSATRRRAKSTSGGDQRIIPTQPVPRPPEHWSAKFNKSSQSLHQVPRPPEPPRTSSSHKRSHSHHRSTTSRPSFGQAPPVPMLPPNPYAPQPPMYPQANVVYAPGPTPFPAQPYPVHYGTPQMVSPQPQYARPMSGHVAQVPMPVSPATPSPGKQPLLKRVLGGLIGRGRTPAPPAEPERRERSRSRSRSRSRRQSMPQGMP